MKAYYNMLLSAYDSLEGRNFTFPQLKRSYVIFNSTRDFLSHVIATSSIEQHDLSSWAWSLTPLIDQHINDSAIAMLNRYILDVSWQ